MLWGKNRNVETIPMPKQTIAAVVYMFLQSLSPCDTEFMRSPEERNIKWHAMFDSLKYQSSSSCGFRYAPQCSSAPIYISPMTFGLRLGSGFTHAQPKGARMPAYIPINTRSGVLTMLPFMTVFSHAKCIPLLFAFGPEMCLMKGSWVQWFRAVLNGEVTR